MVYVHHKHILQVIEKIPVQLKMLYGLFNPNNCRETPLSACEQSNKTEYSLYTILALDTMYSRIMTYLVSANIISENNVHVSFVKWVFVGIK